MRLIAYHPALCERGGAEWLMVERMRSLADLGHDVRLVVLELDRDAWGESLGGMPTDLVASDWRMRLPMVSQWKKLRRRAADVAPLIDSADLVVGFNYPCSLLPAFVDVPNMVWHCCEPARQIHLESANPFLARYAKQYSPDDARCLRWFEGELEFRRQRPRAFVREAEFDRVGIARMRSVIAISEFSSELVHRTFGRKADAVVPPMVRFPRAMSRTGGLSSGGLRVLLHTRLHGHKNADTVLRGFATYRRRDPAATLDVVGEGPERSVLEALAATLGITDAVRFHGYLSQSRLEEVYRFCEVLAFLPMDEPFGMVFPEAAAHGLLLVGPDHGGPMEILDGGRLGATVDALSPDALADALSDIGALSAAEVDRRRRAADRACRERYARETVGPMFSERLAAVVADRG